MYYQYIKEEYYYFYYNWFAIGIRGIKIIQKERGFKILASFYLDLIALNKRNKHMK